MNKRVGTIQQFCAGVEISLLAAPVWQLDAPSRRFAALISSWCSMFGFVTETNKIHGNVSGQEEGSRVLIE